MLSDELGKNVKLDHSTWP